MSKSASMVALEGRETLRAAEPAALASALALGVFVVFMPASPHPAPSTTSPTIAPTRSSFPAIEGRTCYAASSLPRPLPASSPVWC